MKKILTACALGLFLAAGITGCSSSPTTGGSSTTTKKAETPKPPAETPKPK